MPHGFGQRLACACCSPVPSRRHFLGFALATTGLAATRSGRAAEGNYEAMLLSCIDPRVVEPVRDWMIGRGLKGQYSQFVIAGAAIGVVAPAFATWQPAFWDNLATSADLHRIRRLVVVDHRDCGAARIAYGDAAIATPEAETKLHQEATATLRAEVAKRMPKLQVECGLMALDGSIVMFG
jgi:carbonic anhydrase